MDSIAYVSLPEAAQILEARGILTPDGKPYKPATIKVWCHRGFFPNAKTIVVRCGATSRPTWHIPICDLEAFTLRRDRSKPGITTRDAAALLGNTIQPGTVETYIREGKITGAVKIGKDWYVPAESIATYQAMYFTPKPPKSIPPKKERRSKKPKPERKPKPQRYDPGPEKVCKRCEQMRSIDEYVADPRFLDGHSSWCKACYAEYRKRPEQKAKQNQRAKERYADPEWRAMYQAKNNARTRERYHTDPTYKQRKAKYKSVFNHKRRTKTRTGDLTVEQWEEIKAYYGNVCLCCGSIENLQLEHVVPLARGGEHTASNIQVLCKSCNGKKMTKIIDYRPDKGARFR